MDVHEGKPLKLAGCVSGYTQWRGGSLLKSGSFFYKTEQRSTPRRERRLGVLTFLAYDYRAACLPVYLDEYAAGWR